MVIKNNNFHFHINLEKMFNFKGLSHIYATDTNHKAIYANKLQLDIMEEFLNKNRTEIIGHSLDNFLGSQAAEIIFIENESILREETVKQYHNVWGVKSSVVIEMLTFKFPIYNSDGKLEGVFGISQYVNKFSVAKALALGLTKREIDCLVHILEGKTMKQVAKLLALSNRTVERHIDNIKSKLNCSSKFELLIKTMQTGVKEAFCNAQFLESGQVLIDPSDI